MPTNRPMKAPTQTRAMINFVSLDDRPLFDDEFEAAAEELRPVVAEDVITEVDSVSCWLVDESVTDEEICEVRLLAELDAASVDADTEESAASGMLVKDDSDTDADGSAVLAVALVVVPDSECVESVTALSSVETAAVVGKVDAVAAIRLVKVCNNDKTAAGSRGNRVSRECWTSTGRRSERTGKWNIARYVQVHAPCYLL